MTRPMNEAEKTLYQKYASSLRLSINQILVVKVYDRVLTNVSSNTLVHFEWLAELWLEGGYEIVIVEIRKA